MKVFLIVLLSTAGFTQVNLDQPIAIGNADKVFQSSADPASAYIIPNRLMVVTKPYMREVDGEYRIHFDVGLKPGHFEEVQDSMRAIPAYAQVNLRVMRAYDVTIDPKGSMDAPQKFKPVLKALGDMGSIGSATPFLFSIRKIGRTYGRESLALIKSLFTSKYASHLSNIMYEFNAVRGGVPYAAKTSAGIFVAGQQSPEIIKVASAEISGFMKAAYTTDSDLKIIFDAEAKCWEDVNPGEICLKK